MSNVRTHHIVPGRPAPRLRARVAALVLAASALLGGCMESHEAPAPAARVDGGSSDVRVDGGPSTVDGATTPLPAPACAPRERRAGEALDHSRSDCTSDADCTEGRNGRCTFTPYPERQNVCTYDECESDSDCDAGERCACGQGLGQSNACIPANCNSDADCGGATCAPMSRCGLFDRAVSFECQRADDECDSTPECYAEFADTFCTFDPHAERRVCASIYSCS